MRYGADHHDGAHGIAGCALQLFSREFYALDCGFRFELVAQDLFGDRPVAVERRDRARHWRSSASSSSSRLVRARFFRSPCDHHSGRRRNRPTRHQPRPGRAEKIRKAGRRRRRCRHRKELCAKRSFVAERDAPAPPEPFRAVPVLTCHDLSSEPLADIVGPVEPHSPSDPKRQPPPLVKFPRVSHVRKFVEGTPAPSGSATFHATSPPRVPSKSRLFL